MSRKILDFLERLENERLWMSNKSWCEHCQQADLGLIEIVEYIENDFHYLEGKCKKCDNKVINEILIKNR